MTKVKKIIKQEIYIKLIASLDKKIEQAQESISLVKESRDNDTKSSAGDKFETGREMMQIEIDKSEAQLAKSLNLKSDLSKIDLDKECSSVEFGSLVETNNGSYFISIGVGKLTVDNKDFFVISLASPIGKALYQKEVGVSFKFQGKEYLIKSIV